MSVSPKQRRDIWTPEWRLLPLAVSPRSGACANHLQWAIELEQRTVQPYLCALCPLDAARNPDVDEVVCSVLVGEVLHTTLAADYSTPSWTSSTRGAADAGYPHSDGMRDLCVAQGEPGAFCGDPARQISGAPFPGGGVIAVVDLATALAALE
jgi:hypothetical protein